MSVHQALSHGGRRPAGAEARSTLSNFLEGSRRDSGPRPERSSTTPPNANHSRPRGPRRKQPRYPSAGYGSGSTLAVFRGTQIFSSRAARDGFTSQTGSGRPEKTEAPAVQSVRLSILRLLVDFDVAMHDHHKGAKDGIGTAIGCARIRD